MDVDPPSARSSPPAPSDLSTQLLQKDAVTREVEREGRRHNGNISPRTSFKTGAKFDHICANLVIEAVELNSKQKATAYFYCIACDEKRANNSRSRALPHAQKCKVPPIPLLINFLPLTFHSSLL